MQQNAPIKLIHGWGMNRQVWADFIEQAPHALSDRIECLDLPGYGNNDYMPPTYDLTQLTDWLEQQIDQPSHIIGWSLGGLLALNLALRTDPSETSNILSVGLVASTPKFLAESSWPGIQPNVLDGFFQALNTDHNKTIEQFLKIQALGSPNVRSDIKALKNRLFSVPAPQPVALVEGLKLLQTVDLRQQLAQLEQFEQRNPNLSSSLEPLTFQRPLPPPLQIKALFGRLDTLVPINAVAEIKKLSSRMEIEICENSSHAPFISEPTRFEEWLTRCFS